MAGGVDPEQRIGTQPPRVILNREAVKDLPAAEKMNCACGASDVRLRRVKRAMHVRYAQAQVMCDLRSRSGGFSCGESSGWQGASPPTPRVPTLNNESLRGPRVSS